MRELRVELRERSYPIRIGAGLFAASEAWADLPFARHVLLVSDANVAPLYAGRVEQQLPERCARHVHVLAPGESSKSLASAAGLFDALAQLGAGRDAVVIALGGGVVGDLAGFAAACWMRGVACVQVPTTLLAMVDSAVGGKTGVDLPQGKNLVGAFHQPRAVIADLDTLDTLPDRELRAGLAEVVKYGAIIDAEFLAWLEAHAEALLRRDRAALGEAIERSCRHKAAIVARDETESGERALLNFGHSFGHALETLDGYRGLLHGEAVAIGMCCAARLSECLGQSPAEDSARLRKVLQRFGLPTDLPPQVTPARLLETMRLDKKAAQGRLRLVLWRGVGRAGLADAPPDRDLLAALATGISDTLR